MDHDDETLLSNIFKDKFTEKIRRDPEFTIYLSELSALGLDQLYSEPNRLEDERANIRDQTQDLAFHNYRTFIETADCSKGICKDFSKINTHLDNVLETLPVLQDKCNNFLKLSQEISTKRKSNWLTLSRHNDLLELLEIPQLMETCVRNNYYDEALELITYVNRLDKRHSSSIPVVENIVKDVDLATQRMLKSLIQQLRGQIGLPQCLRTTGYLRRLDCFSETELRIKFLQCRDIWLQQVIDQVPTADPQNHLTKIIEVYRVHLFDVITQYKAIFSDDDQFNLYSRSDINDSGLDNDSNDEDSQPQESALFYNWVTEKIGQFLAILKQDLAKGGCAFDTVLSQCMYFGLSFSRVGADFRPFMVPIILEAIENKFNNQCNRAREQLKQTLMIFSVKDVPDITQSSLYTQDSDEKLNYLSSTSTSNNTQPPLELASLGPLAIFCNSLIVALNDLRACCPANMAKFVGTKLNQILLNASNLIKNWIDDKLKNFEIEFGEDKNGGGDQERGEFNNLKNVAKNNILSAARRMSTALESLILFKQKVLSAFFPSNDLCNKLGYHTQDLINNNIGRINPVKCIEPLKLYLPTDEDIILSSDVVKPKDDTKASGDVNLQNLEDQKTSAKEDDLKSDVIQKESESNKETEENINAEEIQPADSNENDEPDQVDRTEVSNHGSENESKNNGERVLSSENCSNVVDREDGA